MAHLLCILHGLLLERERGKRPCRVLLNDGINWYKDRTLFHRRSSRNKLDDPPLT